MDCEDEELLLKWNNHQYNLLEVFEEWLKDESFVDVTLVCDNESLSVHKVVLAASSPFLNKILRDNACEHSVVILNDICLTDMKALLKFIYQGEVSIPEKDFERFLRAADTLQIKGLAKNEGNDYVMGKQKGNYIENDPNEGGLLINSSSSQKTELLASKIVCDSVTSSSSEAIQSCSSSENSNEQTISTPAKDILKTSKCSPIKLEKELVVKLEPLDYIDGNVAISCEGHAPLKEEREDEEEASNKDFNMSNYEFEAGVGRDTSTPQPSPSNAASNMSAELLEKLSKAIAADLIRRNIEYENDNVPVSTSRRSKKRASISTQDDDYYSLEDSMLESVSKKRKPSIKTPWSDEEKEEVQKYFREYIFMKKIPGKQEITKILNISTKLRRRTWRNVKDHIRLCILRLIKYG